MKIPTFARQALSIALATTAFLVSGLAHADQLASIMAAKKIRVAIDLAVPPFGMKDAQLNSTGSDVETAKLLSKWLGVEFELVPVSGANRIPSLLTDKADVVVSSFSVTPERAKVVSFSKPYAAVLAVIGAPASMSLKAPADLVGKRVAVGRGSTMEAALGKIAPPGVQVLRYEDESTSITSVISGQADVIATAPPLLKRLNEMAPNRNFETKIVMNATLIGIGLRKDEPALQAKLDEFVRVHLKSDLSSIYKKYHGADLPPEVLKAD